MATAGIHVIIFLIYLSINGLDSQVSSDVESVEGTCPIFTDCVPFYLCSNGVIVSSGVGILTSRLGGGPCKDYTQICCKIQEQRSEPLRISPSRLASSVGCGYRNPNGVGLALSGLEQNLTQFGEFPWMIAIYKEPENLTFVCGGALIHPQAVITAAHCVSNKSATFIVRAGEWDTNTITEPFPHQDRKVAKTILHPYYEPGPLYNDIAILYLDSPVEISDNVNVLCLPQDDNLVNIEKCFVTGWGKDTYGKQGKYPKVLKKIDLDLVLREPCQEKLRKTRLSKYFILHDNFICAGGEFGKDVCTGDGGSPLVCPIDGQTDRYYHAGIVSWGIDCGLKDVPGVYVDVASLRHWILEELALNSLNSTSYEYLAPSGLIPRK